MGWFELQSVDQGVVAANGGRGDPPFLSMCVW